MKRDWDLVRDLLLAIEEQTGGEVMRQISMPDRYTSEQVVSHLRLVNEAGFINGNIKFVGDHLLLAIHGLSWEGHDFLDSIRNDGVWEKTQEKAASVGGSVALETLKAIAAKVAESMLGL